MTKAKIAALLTDLQKRYGTDRVMMANNIPVGPPISTGSLALDAATNYGGFPSNRVVELYGREGTGKTTLALQTMLNGLKQYPDQGALFLDVEHKIDADWLEMIVGPQLLKERVIYIQPTSIENATNIYRQAVESGNICVAILDSIGGAPTIRRSEDAETGHYGGNAIGVGEFARSAATWSSIYNTLTIGINQTRENMDPRGFADKTPGGRAWRHACILRIELVRGKDTETIKLPGEEKPIPVGHTVYGKVRKNQVGAEGRQAYWWFYNIATEEHDFGIDTLDEITRLSLVTRVVALKGGWYHHPALPEYANDKKGDHKVQGLVKFQQQVKGDKALQATIISEVMAGLKDHVAEIAPLSDPEAPVEEMSGMMKMYAEGTGGA